MAREKPDPGAWARLSDEEIAQREAEARVREEAAAEAESVSAARQPLASEERVVDPEVVQIRILTELQSIRFRLGVLVLFFVVIPIAVGFIVGFAVGFD